MKIANIGSSFSAGPGIYPLVAPEAGRSSLNFAHLLADSLGAELIDLSVSGATLLNMINEPQIARGHKFAPQVEGIPLDVDLVLILGGGNDMHYVSNIIAETWAGWLIIKTLNLLSAVVGSGSTAADGEEVYRRYSTLLDMVHAKVPRARVIVVEYLTILGPDTVAKAGTPLTSERSNHHQDVAIQLGRATNRAVDERQSWCEVLHTAHLSEAHGLGSQDPWVEGLELSVLLRRGAWAHPNARGMQAVASALLDRFANDS